MRGLQKGSGVEVGQDGQNTAVVVVGRGEVEFREDGRAVLADCLLGDDQALSDGAVGPALASRMGCLLDALSRAYDVLGSGGAAGGDEVFRDLVLARIIEPVSKLDSLRVLEEAGAAAASYRTVLRRCPPMRSRRSGRSCLGTRQQLLG
jgi:hypothetical protein